MVGDVGDFGGLRWTSRCLVHLRDVGRWPATHRALLADHSPCPTRPLRRVSLPAKDLLVMGPEREAWRRVCILVELALLGLLLIRGRHFIDVLLR